jgi:hypothetical protein
LAFAALAATITERHFRQTNLLARWGIFET